MKESVHVVAVASDIHFPEHHEKCWGAFRNWHADVRPDLTVLLGDIVDLAMLSSYPQEADKPVYAKQQIELAVREINQLNAEAGLTKVMFGNHEARWARTVFGHKAQQLKGFDTLTLRYQFYEMGLDPRVMWVKEGFNKDGLWIGKPNHGILARHGDRQASRFGTANIAAKLARENPGYNVICGHHHVGQMHQYSVLGESYMAIANSHLSGDHEYSPSPRWTRGFTVLTFYGATRLRDCKRFQAQQIMMQEDGTFAYNGKIYKP